MNNYHEKSNPTLLQDLDLFEELTSEEIEAIKGGCFNRPSQPICTSTYCPVGIPNPNYKPKPNPNPQPKPFPLPFFRY